MIKELLKNEEDLKWFDKLYCFDDCARYNQKPEKYPCVALCYTYEDHYSRDWAEVDFVYLEDFEKDE